VKIYLDTSVILVYLFGQYKEPKRHADVSQIFDRIKTGQLFACISLYAFQEIYAFCQEHYQADVSSVFRLALLRLLENPLEIAPLLARSERLIYERRFRISDASDSPHVVSAYINHCDAIVSYDSHFDEVTDFITSLTPETLIGQLNCTEESQ
jgi:predicted nucleic acid-binding protein